MTTNKNAGQVLTEALESIAANTCCDQCREAALVARAALAAATQAQPEEERLRDMAASGAKDAERYRWLRDKATGEIVFDHTEDQSDGGHHFALYVPFDGREIPDDEASGQTLDEAIDAAIAATKRGGA